MDRRKYLTLVKAVSGPPRGNLVLWCRPLTDNIGLSVSDYANLTAPLQAALFTDPSTPIVFDDFDALWTVISAVSGFNELTTYACGTAAKGVAIYIDGTDLSIFNRALRYFGLDQIEIETVTMNGEAVTMDGEAVTMGA